MSNMLYIYVPLVACYDSLQSSSMSHNKSLLTRSYVSADVDEDLGTPFSFDDLFSNDYKPKKFEAEWMTG